MDTLKEIQNLKNGFRNMQDQLELMIQTLDSLELKLRRQETPQLQKNFRDFRADEFSDSTKRITLQALSNFPSELNPSANYGRIAPGRVRSETFSPRPPKSSSSDVISDFNDLANQSGYDAKRARNEFISKYNVRTFSCANHEARMNEPIPPPKFVETDPNSGGDYWAVPLKSNMFAVFPNVNTYTDNYHRARAAGMIFNSNFEPGKTCKGIIIEKPAIFECASSAWILKTPGVLKLR